MTSEPQTESGRARAALLQVIKDWGLDDPRSDPPHGWRCQHPELSDPATCGHVDALLDDLEEAASKAVAEVLDRLEPLLTPFPNEAIRALIASERKP